MANIFRVHPAINIGRVGNSQEFNISPETPAGLPVDGIKDVNGGLPIKPGTESDHITSDDIRDKNGAFKRQAARFRVYVYPKHNPIYPSGKGTEVVIGSKIDGKTVKDILWQVHVANKKANWYQTENPDIPDTELLIEGYANGKLPPLRNLEDGPDINNKSRIRKFTIDPGPRVIKGSDSGSVHFNAETIASWVEDGRITKGRDYPKSFPEDAYTNFYAPQGNVDSLGELRTEKNGRLLVLPGYGRAVAWKKPDGTIIPMDGPVDNDGWYDDTSDGPVSCWIVYDDDSIQEVHGAWVVSTDPSYAPQTINAVTLWDDIYDTWLRKLHLQPEIYKRGFNDKFEPSFKDHVYPTFAAAALQRWNTNLPDIAINAHDKVGQIDGKDNPNATIMAGLAFIRNPNEEGQKNVGAPLMPLSLGDQGSPFMSVSLTQYFFLKQWSDSKYKKTTRMNLGPGEYLDRAVLINCLGGRFSPGIDMTFIVRQPEMYITDWQGGAGPFRIRPKNLNYGDAQSAVPFLTAGWTPLHSDPKIGLEPGDTSKFMAIPWHADYNSCAIHNTSPNPANSTTLYWSWPAQRPVTVYVASEVQDGKLGPIRFSMRGKGTETNNNATAGRYQGTPRGEFEGLVTKWNEIGVIIQGSAIAGDVKFPADYYLEVESQLDPPVTPWPLNSDETGS